MSRLLIFASITIGALLADGLSGGGAKATTPTPAPLNSNAASDSGDDLAPQVTSDGAGNWVAVWYSSEDLGGVIGSDFDILVSRSSNNGDAWTAPAALNTNAAMDSGSDAFPQVSTDGAGTWIAVWQSNDTLGGTIGSDFDILVSHSTNNGSTWAAPSPLNTNAETDARDDLAPQLANDGAGNWVVVWHSNEDLGGTIGTDFDILVSRSSNNGSTWTPPVPLNTNADVDSGGDAFPQVTTDGLENWVAVWHSTDSLGGTIGTDADILVARSINKGTTWTAPSALNTNAGTDSGGDFSPQVSTDGLGGWVAVWQSTDSLGGTIGTDFDILLAKSSDNGGTWTAPAPLHSNAATDTGVDLGPQVTADGAGNWVALWRSNEDIGGTNGTDFDILTSRSADNAASWSPPLPMNTTAASDTVDDLDPQTTTDEAGNWVTIWVGRVGTDNDIMFTNCSPPVDADCDTIIDQTDNCPSIANPSQVNADNDPLGDRCDNCPTVTNPNQANTDAILAAAGASVTGDGSGDDCDSDDDNDTFPDPVETNIGTGPLDNCVGPPGSGGDAWPLDNNADGFANVIDIIAYKGKIPSPVDANHPKRLDLDDNNFLNVLDIIKYKGLIPSACS